MAIPAVLAVLLPPPSDGHASSVPADSVHFCLPVDPEQRQNNAPQPAGKWASDLNVGEPRTVRLFYFLPNDRPYRTEVVDSMKAGILDLRTFFAGQMETHGHGNSTFRIETDEQGDPIVHRVDGDHADSHYSRRGYTEGEIARAFDNSKNIVLIVMDVSASSAHGRGTGAKDSGWAIIYGDWNWFAAAHELGHSFGLHHDFRDNEFIMSYGRADRSSAKLSACAAEFLSVHPYLDADVPLAIESPPTVELVSSEFPFGSVNTPVQLRVRDDDGLHQVILFVRPKNPFLGGTPEVKMCDELSGETDTVVEFDFDGRLPSDNVGTAPEAHTTLSNTVLHPIYVVAIDTAGNRTSTLSLKSFTLEAGHSPQHVATIERPNFYDIGDFAFSPDGALLAIGESGRVELLDAKNKETITTFHHSANTIPTVAFSPDGTLLAAGSKEGTIKVWNVTSEAEVATLAGHADQVASLDFSPEGSLLASGSFDHTVKLWNATNWTNDATLEGHTERVAKTAFLRDGKLASVSVYGTVRLWNVSTRTQISTIETGAKGHVAVSMDGTLVASPISWSVKFWDLATGAQTGAVNDMRDYNRAYPVFSPDGTILAVTAFGLIELWDVSKSELLASISGGPGGVRRMVFSPDGRMLVGNDARPNSRQIKFWDVSGWTDGAVVTQVWSGTATGGTWGNDFNNGNATGYGYSRHYNAGSISNPTFTFRGATYTIHGISISRIGNNLTHQISLLISPGLSSCDRRLLFFSQLSSSGGLALSDAGVGSAYGASWFFWRETSHMAWPVGFQYSWKITLHPTAPDAPIVSAIDDGNQVVLHWTTPCDGGIAIARHEYREKAGTGSFGSWMPVPNSGAGGVNEASYTVTGLNNPAQYTFEVRAVNTVGEGETSAEARVSNLPAVPLSERTAQVRNGIVAAVPDISDSSIVTEAHLAAITRLRLGHQNISSLKPGDFSGLTGLTRLHLPGNQLRSLPDGVFEGLTSLTELRLGGNPVDPLPLNVSLEKIGADQFKAVAPTGAPFDVVLPLSVTNGIISGGATTVAISRGSVESQPLTVTRTSGTTAAVTVNIGTLPGLPNGHFGYVLVKSSDLPLEIFGSGVTGGQASTDFNGDGRTDFVDFFLFADAYGSTNAKFDLDGNGTVDFADFFRFVDAFGA